MRPTLEHSSEARTWYFHFLGFLGSALLGLMVGVSLEPFLWLVLSRPLTALVLALLPKTTMGSYRPYLLGLTGLTVLATLGWSSSSLELYLCVLGLYLTLDVSLDGQVVQYCPAQEWLGRWAQLLGLRTLGLVAGLMVNGASLPALWLKPLNLCCLVIVFLTLIGIPETQDTCGWSCRIVGSPLPRMAVVIDSLRASLSRAALLDTLLLSAIGVLSGTIGCQIFPVALLTSERLTEWLGMPGLWLLVFLLLAILGLALERLSEQALVCLIYPLLVVALGFHLKHPSLEVSLVVQVTSGLAILVALRRCLRTPRRSDPALQGTFLAIIWLLSVVAGSQIAQSAPPQSLRLAQVASAVLLVLMVGATLRDWKRAARVTSVRRIDCESDRQARGQGLHGDKKLDFTAAPSLPYKKRSRWLSRLWYALTIRLPVTLALALLSGLTLAALWQAGDKKSAWKTQMETAVNAMKTELFLTSIKRRTEEELLAANRLPDDWSEFIASNFQLDGRPMKDRDFWGTPLNFEASALEIRISSAGGDRKFGTPDDILRFVKRPDGVR